MSFLIREHIRDLHRSSEAVITDIKWHFGECATHLQLLEVFSRLRSQTIQSSELDKAFGVKQEHKVVYRKQYLKGKKEPVKLRDSKWREKRRQKWVYFLSIAVARFEAWAMKTGDVAMRNGDNWELAFLPPLDILMHKAIDASTWTYTLPPPSARSFQTEFNLAPDLLQYLIDITQPPQVSSSTWFPSRVARVLSFFGAGTMSAAALSALLGPGPPAPESCSPETAFLWLLHRAQQRSSELAPLAENVQRQAAFVDKMHQHLWIRSPAVEGTLRRARDRYGQFLRLFRLYPGAMLVPTLDIDLVWHTHMLSAAGYERGMLKRVGRFVDHDDKLGQGVLADGMGKMRDWWRVRFGSEYETCLCWDCQALMDALEEYEEEGEEGKQTDGIEKVVEKVRSEVEYHRVVEIARRKGWPLLPVRVKTAENKDRNPSA
ncbi:hypothetical protein VTI74DRAFT_11271 [Chaetomium olivicolor]